MRIAGRGQRRICARCDAAHYAAWLSKAARVVAIASFMGRPIPRCHGGLEAAKAQEVLNCAVVVLLFGPLWAECGRFGSTRLDL